MNLKSNISEIIYEGRDMNENLKKIKRYNFAKRTIRNLSIIDPQGNLVLNRDLVRSLLREIKVLYPTEEERWK